jgi:ABC-type polysaccharide/polyol phosphate transport system ATPase subunit
MEKEIAIKAEGISKTFKIPHEKISTLKGAFVSAFKSHSYEEFKALDDVSFEVKKGEFFGIIGRNGSGKSTLLKILAGIYQPDKGKVKINGLVSPFLELGIGFNPELSGRDNVFLNAAVLGLSHKQIEERFDDIVAFSELRRFIDQKVKNYSSGMQVRLAFSVAIHANRDILLMDEVLAVGDTNFQGKCLEEFNRYKDQGKTVILVTHDIGVVQRYCDRTMLLRNGKVEMIGDPHEVGSAYIEQNMSDEERRMVEDEKRKHQKVDKKINQPDENQEKQPVKQKLAEITKVEFLDKDGNAKNVFRTGDDISIRVRFKRNKPIEDFDFGMAIYNIENNCIFGTSTLTHKLDIHKILEKGFYQINVKNIPLGENSYYIKAGIYGAKNKCVFDHLGRSEIFKIAASTRNLGMVALNFDWD